MSVTYRTKNVSCTPWPANAWPYVVAAWPMVGTLIAFLRPSVTRLETVPPELSAN
jgi:hypothetical protein